MSSHSDNFQCLLATLPAQVGGDVALDLANTIDFRGTPSAVDHIASFDGLLAWSAKARTLDPAAIAIFRDDAGNDGTMAERVIADVGRLRAAIFQIGSAAAAGAHPAENELATLHEFAHATLRVGRLAPVGDGKLVIDFHRGGVHAAILGPLAWAAVGLFTGDRPGRLKQCPPDDCRWLFLDQTKNRSRRWCEMATCGNRDKAARHRKRR